MNPIVKWTGGKRAMAPWIAERVAVVLDVTGGRYVEPFLGGGAVALAVARPDMVLADACHALMATYVTITKGPGRVWRRYKTLIDQPYTADSFHGARHAFNTHEVRAWGDMFAKVWTSASHIPFMPPGTKIGVDDERKDQAFFAALFLYLNAMAFNGLYRVNRAGNFNAPFRGHTAPVSFRSPTEILEFAHLLRECRLLCQSFEHTFDHVAKGDFVFCDPPYADTFSQYTSNGFGLDRHRQLAACVREAHLRGAKVLLTNTDTPEIRNMYSWATIVSSTEMHATDRHGKTSSKASCVIIATDPAVLPGELPVENT